MTAGHGREERAGLGREGAARSSAPVAAGHGTSAPNACSVGFERHGVSAYGSAAQAGFWLAVEQTGPWGRSAATESHLPPEAGRQLDAACTSRGGRLALLRAPGRHADAHHPGGRTAYLAFCGVTGASPGAAGDDATSARRDPWMLAVRDAFLEDLLGADLDALARGDRAAVQSSLPHAEPAEPVLLVCTNGRRDVCCALRGRPVALAAAQASAGRVWESSHTGGHRFAPTGVLLPFGATLARLDPALCGDVLADAAAGRLPARALGPVHDRGRSPLAPAAQAAESFVRQQTGETALGALTTTADRAGVHEVVHVDGRRWRVATELRPADPGTPDLPESCGKPPVAIREWRLRLL